MSRDVTKSGGGLTEAPKLSPELRKILQRRKVVPDYGGDDGVSAGGGNFRDGVWEQPEWVDARDRDEAAKALPGYEAMLRPWTHDQIRQQFLLPLWNVTKHQNDTNWDAVAIVYPMFLDAMPGWCFRRDRLMLAAQHAFAWFPTVQELVAFMEPDRQAIIAEAANLKKISETTTTPPKTHQPGKRPWAEGGAEDHAKYLREKADRERKELIEIMRKRDEEAGLPPAPPTPKRAPGEDDKAYVHRLRLHMDAELDRATKAMRNRMRGARPKGPDKPVPPPTADQMRAAYGTTGIKPEDVRTQSETAQNTMSGSEP